MSDQPHPDQRLISQAFQIANAAVIADIESEARCVRFEGDEWWDITLMVHPGEHANPVIDQCRMALDYAVGAGLVNVHPRHAYLVRITRG